MKRITFGTPEQFVPTKFCKKLNYSETELKYDVDSIKFALTSRGCVVELPLMSDEAIFGFGLQLKGFNHIGTRLKLKSNSDPVANTGDSHAPVPFFVSSKGYGIYFDTARYAEVYAGCIKKKKRSAANNNDIVTDADALYDKSENDEDMYMNITIPHSSGIDIYIFEGTNISDVISQYNMFSGGGCKVPEWGLGVMYRAYAKSRRSDIEKLVYYFKDSRIPCDIIGLEPGWQTHSYSCSYVWDEDRLGDIKSMISYLKSNGYHVNLWEHGFVDLSSPIYDSLYDYSGDYEVWKGLVPDFSLEEVRNIFAEYHRENFVDIGIDGFKLDECDNSDFKPSAWSFPDSSHFPSGMDGEQYHQLFGVLYMQAIIEALGNVGTLSEVRNAGALCASYPFVLYSDLYEHGDFVRGVVNSGFSGLLWTPEVRHAETKKEFIRRLQSNVFSVQCIINGWYCEEVPWKKLDCENEVRELLNLRKTLIPMLKEAFDEYQSTGKPPVRALVADYTDDKETYMIDDEYIFCDRLIVAPITSESDERMVYLPDGRWVDYFTKEPVSSGWFKVETNNIPVYEKIAEVV